MMQNRRLTRSYSAALLTLGAAAIHFAAVPEHFSEYWPYGVFFVCLGTAQVGLGAGLIFAPSRRLYAFALAGTLIVIGIWLLSRTTGLPIAPTPWRPEQMAFPDLAATVLEAVTCLVLVRRLRRPFGNGGRVRRALTMLPAVLFTPLLAVGGVGGLMSPMPVAFSAAPFIAGQTSTSVANLTAPDGTEPVKSFTLTAAVSRLGGHAAWAYNGIVPGPEIRVTQGDRVRVTLVNHLPNATSIHWHGIRVPNADDGVAGITQDAVQPGRSFVYDFIANDAGTYWYHSHQDTSNQLPKGLFGSLVVDPKSSSGTALRDYTLMVHFLPDSNSVAVNGTPNLHLDANAGDTVRLRLIDAVQGTGMSSEGALETLVLLGVPYSIAALDGHDLHEPQQLGPERIALGMGQRADLVFTMPASGAVRLIGLKGAAGMPWEKQPTASVTIGSGRAPADVDVSSLPRFDLTRYGTPASDPILDATHFDVISQIALNGGPMFRNGTLDFADTFNGHASPFITPIHVRLGDMVRLHIVNHTQGSHPIHIHGHIFSVLAKNGQPISGSPVHLDAILVGPGETWDVGFLADNPGIWMLHCHILIHAAGGMSMTINYDGIATPFTMGRRSGNIPE
jgi:FtsP/CotA-like multicopper oxidase with cupredoxin domain